MQGLATGRGEGRGLDGSRRMKGGWNRWSRGAGDASGRASQPRSLALWSLWKEEQPHLGPRAACGAALRGAGAFSVKPQSLLVGERSFLPRGL